MTKILKKRKGQWQLKAFFFNSLFHWMAAYDCFHISSFHDFFFYFFLLFLFRCFSCIRPVYLGVPFGFNEIQLLIKICSTL
jgi:hypothetical protein